MLDLNTQEAAEDAKRARSGGDSPRSSTKLSGRGKPRGRRGGRAGHHTGRWSGLTTGLFMCKFRLVYFDDKQLPIVIRVGSEFSIIRLNIWTVKGRVWDLRNASRF